MPAPEGRGVRGHSTLMDAGDFALHISFI